MIHQRNYKPRDLQDLWEMPKERKAFLYASLEKYLKDHKPKPSK
ncbi:hypothetical protein SD78_4133 [Bacillus badius]|nr:hypothetical protein SD78_4133 [Bacillus badius]